MKMTTGGLLRNAERNADVYVWTILENLTYNTLQTLNKALMYSNNLEKVEQRRENVSAVAFDKIMIGRYS